jgi:hypothetical protein
VRYDKNVSTHRALVMDVDGVVSPVHGKTAWGDDVVTGRSGRCWCPHPVRKLDEIAATPDLAASG